MVEQTELLPTKDDLRMAQRIMFEWLVDRVVRAQNPPLPEPTLRQVYREKQRLIETYVLLIADKDPAVTERWYRDKFRERADAIAGFNQVAA